MPHYKCETCRTRLRVPEADAKATAEICPRCGSPLESVAVTSEVVGFRAVPRADASADALRARGYERVTDRADEFILRRVELRRRERAVAEAETARADGEPPATVALPLPDR